MAQLDEMSVLTLAFIGDAVFTLFVREKLSKSLDYKTGELTRRAAYIISAKSQSRLLGVIEGELTDAEADIVRRCRNAHTNNAAKNASAGEYHRATGLEGLIGYLHLSGNTERMNYLFKQMELI